MTTHRLFSGFALSLIAGAATLAYARPATHHEADAAAATPTQALSHEHRVVEQMADVLVAMADDAEKQGRPDAKAGAEAIDFLKGFLDRCHHAKEEQLLFPAMEKQGTDAAQVKALLKDHDEGRAHVKAMAKALDTADSAPAASAQAFAEHARAYASLLRKHIAKEEENVFPAADKALTPEAQAQLAKGFERVEAEETGAGVHEKYLGIANELADRYGVAKAAEDAEGTAHTQGHHAH